MSKRKRKGEDKEDDVYEPSRVHLSRGALKYWNLKFDSIDALPLLFKKSVDFEYLVRTSTIHAMSDIRSQLTDELATKVILVPGNRGSGKTTAMLFLGHLLGREHHSAFVNCNTVIKVKDFDTFTENIHTSILFSLTEFVTRTQRLGYDSVVLESEKAVQSGNILLVDRYIDKLLSFLSSTHEKTVLFLDNLDKPAPEKYRLLRDFFRYDQRLFENLREHDGVFTFISVQPFICDAICSNPETSSVAGKTIEVNPWTTDELDRLLINRLKVASIGGEIQLYRYFSSEARSLIYNKNDFNPRWVLLAVKKLFQKRYETDEDKEQPISIDATFFKEHPKASEGAKLVFTEFDLKFDTLDGLVARSYPKEFLRIRKALRENSTMAYDMMDSLVSLFFKQKTPSERVKRTLIETGLLRKSGRKLEVSPDIKRLLEFLNEQLPPDPDSVRYFFLSRPL